MVPLQVKRPIDESAVCTSEFDNLDLGLVDAGGQDGAARHGAAVPDQQVQLSIPP